MSPSTVSGPEKREFASEIKFLIDGITAERIRAWARENMAPDPNAGGATGDTYGIASLYFDNPDYAVFHRRGWLRYSKFRIRRYGGASHFLERKLKIGGRVTKRRTALSAQELARIDALPASALWFPARVAARRLQPVVRIDYERTARVLATPAGPIRLTLDEMICAAPVEGPRFHERAPAKRLTDRVVLELKFRRDTPVLFRDLAAQFSLNPQPFSKYRTAVQALGLASSPDLTDISLPSAATAPAPLFACPSS